MCIIFVKLNYFIWMGLHFICNSSSHWLDRLWDLISVGGVMFLCAIVCVRVSLLGLCWSPACVSAIVPLWHDGAIDCKAHTRLNVAWQKCMANMLHGSDWDRQHGLHAAWHIIHGWHKCCCGLHKLGMRSWAHWTEPWAEHWAMRKKDQQICSKTPRNDLKA